MNEGVRSDGMERDPRQLVRIPGELTSTSVNGIVSSAEEIYDYRIGENQEAVNKKTENHLSQKADKIEGGVVGNLVAIGPNGTLVDSGGTGGGGGGGTSNYNQLTNRPQLNDVTVEGNHNGAYYGLVDQTDPYYVFIQELVRGKVVNNKLLRVNITRTTPENLVYHIDEVKTTNVVVSVQVLFNGEPVVPEFVEGGPGSDPRWSADEYNEGSYTFYGTDMRAGSLVTPFTVKYVAPEGTVIDITEGLSVNVSGWTFYAGFNGEEIKASYPIYCGLGTAPVVSDDESELLNISDILSTLTKDYRTRDQISVADRIKYEFPHVYNDTESSRYWYVVIPTDVGVDSIKCEQMGMSILDSDASYSRWREISTISPVNPEIKFESDVYISANPVASGSSIDWLKMEVPYEYDGSLRFE